MRESKFERENEDNYVCTCTCGLRVSMLHMYFDNFTCDILLSMVGN